MTLAVQIFALFAAILHLIIFCMESIWFMNPRIYRRFGAANATDAEINRLFAFNQGFYNLFLSIGVLSGVFLLHFTSHLAIAQTLVLFNCACMLAAAVVLFLSAGKKMFRGAFIQGIFPLLTWLSWLML